MFGRALTRRITSPSQNSGGLFLCLTGLILASTFCTYVFGQFAGQGIEQAGGGQREFQPGVNIDWSRPAVVVEGHVVLRKGAVEFLACFAGKEHESVVRLDAKAEHVYMALGLIGITPGHPPEWDETGQRYSAAIGSLIDASIVVLGEDHVEPRVGFEWLRDIEFGRSPIDRPWIFAGSRGGTEGGIAADRTGEGFALVDMPNCLACLARSRSSSNEVLWAEADTEDIPPTGSRVHFILTPARLRKIDAVMDFRGAVSIGGRLVRASDLAELIDLNRRLDASYSLVVRSEALLGSDVSAMRERLWKLGLPDEALVFNGMATGAGVKPCIDANPD